MVMLMIALATSVVFAESAITALLCLISLFLSVFFLLLLSGFEFFPFLYLIVYAGAIIMMFLFVLMFYNHKISISLDLSIFEFLVVGFCSAKFLKFFLNLLINESDTTPFSDFEEYMMGNPFIDILETNLNDKFFINDTKKFSVILFNDLSNEFLVIGGLLLIIMIGLISILLNFYEYYIYLHENKTKNKNL